MAGTAIAQIVGSSSDTLRRIVVTCVGDAAAGTFPSVVLPAFAGRLIAIETIPHAPLPTAGWAIVVTDAAGHDVLEGVGAARTQAVQKAPIVFSGTSTSPPITSGDVLTLAITGSVVNSAQIVVVLYFSLGG